MTVDILARSRTVPLFHILSRYGRLAELKLSRLSLKLWFVIGLLLSIVVWSGDIWLLPLASLLPVLWSIAPNRSKAAVLALGYHAGASWALIAGIIRVLDTGAFSAIALWLLGGTVPAAIYGILHSYGQKSQPLRFSFAMILCAFPPILTGWANPVTIAGLWFPGFGWLGLLATAVILAALASQIALHLKSVTIILLSILGGVAPLAHNQIRMTGHITHAGFSSGTMDGHEYERLQAASDYVARDRSDIVALPEGYAGLWGDAAATFWPDSMRQANAGTIVVTGAFVSLARGGYENVAVVLDRGHAAIIKQRMPVPLGMWKPWSASSVPATFFRGSTVMTSKGRIGVLNCYEIVVVWTALDTMIDQPDFLVGIGNIWWGRGTNIGRVQTEIMTAWGRLFNVPIAVSLNE